MGYNINVSGRKADALSAMRSQIAAQSASLTGATERQHLEQAGQRVEETVNSYAGENDSVSISLAGHVSQADTSLGISQTVGVSISKSQATPSTGATSGATAAAPTASSPTANPVPVTQAAPVAGAPSAATGTSSTGRSSI